MYDFSSLKRGVENPELIIRKLAQLYYTRGNRYNYNPKGQNFLDEDWDNLIILDACRYDVFSDEHTFEGTLDSRISKGSATYEFVPATFRDRQLHDLVYISSNHWFLKLHQSVNSEIHSLIDIAYEHLEEKYRDDSGYKITPPEAVTDYAIKATNDFPRKKLLIHFVQPHYPFLGEFGRSKFKDPGTSLQTAVNNTDASREDVWKAYRENLQLALSEVKRLLPHLDGKTVITADHGEMLGEKYWILPVRDYGHHAGIYIDPLVKVPWFTPSYNSRKKVVSEKPTKQTVVDDETVDNRLRDLGYKV